MLVQAVFREQMAKCWSKLFPDGTPGTNETEHRKGERSNREHHVFTNPMLMLCLLCYAMFIRKKEPGPSSLEELPEVVAGGRKL